MRFRLWFRLGLRLGLESKGCASYPTSILFSTCDAQRRLVPRGEASLVLRCAAPLALVPNPSPQPCLLDAERRLGAEDEVLAEVDAADLLVGGEFGGGAVAQDAALKE